MSCSGLETLEAYEFGDGTEQGFQAAILIALTEPLKVFEFFLIDNVDALLVIEGVHFLSPFFVLMNELVLL